MNCLNTVEDINDGFVPLTLRWKEISAILCFEWPVVFFCFSVYSDLWLVLSAGGFSEECGGCRDYAEPAGQIPNLPKI